MNGPHKDCNKTDEYVYDRERSSPRVSLQVFSVGNVTSLIYTGRQKNRKIKEAKKHPHPSGKVVREKGVKISQ